MDESDVSWHEGDATEYFTRTIYLYFDNYLKGFVAESGGLGWLVFKFSIQQPCGHLPLDEAKSYLIAICQQEEGD